MHHGPMTDFEKLQKTFSEIGIKFTLDDDSEESPDMDNLVDTVITVETEDHTVCFMFMIDGSYKETISF